MAPRPHLVHLEQREIHQRFFRDPDGLLDRFEERGVDELLDLWDDAGRRLDPALRLPRPNDAKVAVAPLEGRRTATLILTKPREVGEPFWLVLMTGPSVQDPRRPIAAYWVVRSVADGAGGWGLEVIEWTRDRRCSPVGAVPPERGEAWQHIPVLARRDPEPALPAFFDLTGALEELGRPVECPECGALWNDEEMGFDPQAHVLDVECDRGHPARFALDAVELARFELHAATWLVSKPVRFHGGPDDGRVLQLPVSPTTQVKGSRGSRYVYVAEDAEFIHFRVDT